MATIADAVVGELVSQLLSKVIEMKDRAKNFKPTLLKLEDILKSLQQDADEIEAEYAKRDRASETEGLKKLMKNGTKLVQDCSKKFPWMKRCWTKAKYQKKLDELHKSIETYYSLKIQGQTLATVLRIENKVNRLGLPSNDRIEFRAVRTPLDPITVHPITGAAGQVSLLSSLRTGKITWKIRARVIRIWEACPPLDPLSPFSLNVVLIDSQGTKIEAIARKGLMAKFKSELREGKVYGISYFAVEANSGGFMASTHEHKIFFNEKTKVEIEEDTSIPLNVYSFKNSAEIMVTDGECDHLIDMIGLVTNVSSERQYNKGGNLMRMIELEFTDEMGKINCALFGHFVDDVKKHVSTDGHRMPIVILQFAKIKTFKGEIVIQSVMNATSLLWNPPLPEVDSFRGRLALHDIDADKPLTEPDTSIDDVHVISLEEEFLSLYPRKTIQELHDSEEDGVFVVKAQVAGLIEGEKWWYSSCRCHRADTNRENLFYCEACCNCVLSVTPRFRVKIEVKDNGVAGTFVLFDTDCQQLLNKPCKDLVVLSKGKKEHEYPAEMKELIGRELLFKVVKSMDHGTRFDDSYKVKKICANSALIESFSDSSAVLTPHNLVRPSKFTHCGEGSQDRVLDLSANLSEIGPNAVSLDDISSGDGSFVKSSGQSSVSGVSIEFERPAKKLKLRPVKLEMD